MSCGLVVNYGVDGKDNHVDDAMEFRDIMIISVRIIGLLLLLAALLLLHLDGVVFFLLLELNDVMNLGFDSPPLNKELIREGYIMMSLTI